MTRNKTLIGGLIGVGIVSLLAWPVFAHCGRCVLDTKQMVRLMEQGQVGLSQAVATAEEHTKGKAVVARCELEEGKLEIEVYCLVGEKIQEVEIDGATGKVTEVEDHKMLPKVDEEEKGEKEEHEHGHEHEHDD